MTSQLDVMLEQYGSDLAERKARAKANFNKALTAIFDELPEANVILIQGHTPAFNDGDPCTHSQSVAVDNCSTDYLLDRYSGDVEDLDDEERDIVRLMSDKPFQFRDESYDREQDKYVTNPLPEDPHQANCVKACRLLNAMVDDISLIYDTDFTLTITRTDDGFDIKNEFYDCGY